MATKKSNDIAKLVKELAEDLHTITRLKFGKPSVRKEVLEGIVSEVVAGATAGMWSKGQRQVFEVLFLQEENKVNLDDDLACWGALVNYGIEKGLARAREAHGYNSSPVTALECHVCGGIRDIAEPVCHECEGNGIGPRAGHSEGTGIYRQSKAAYEAEQLAEHRDPMLDTGWADFVARRAARIEAEYVARRAAEDAAEAEAASRAARADFEAGLPA
jgi:hypothetical protein